MPGATADAEASSSRNDEDVLKVKPPGDVEDGLLEPLLGGDNANREPAAEGDSEKKDPAVPPVGFFELFFFADKVSGIERVRREWIVLCVPFRRSSLSSWLSSCIQTSRKRKWLDCCPGRKTGLTGSTARRLHELATSQHPHRQYFWPL